MKTLYSVPGSGSQFNFTFDQKIQLNVTGTIGDKLKISTNYNTDAQFQFENQVKLDYTGHPDEIVQKIELGTVSMPLNTTLITGSQALFGLKTKLKFGRLNVTSILSQQRSKSQTITINNGSQQGAFNLTSANYDANKHYFLSQFFRNNYNAALANIPLNSSSVNVTKIEVWTTNRINLVQQIRAMYWLLWTWVKIHLITLHWYAVVQVIRDCRLVSRGLDLPSNPTRS